MYQTIVITKVSKMLFHNVLPLIFFVKILSASKDDIFQLEVRTTNIGRVKYRDGEVVLSQNQKKETDIFFTPFPHFAFNSTECQDNELTGHTGLILAVQLYNDGLIDTVHAYLNKFHPAICNTNSTQDRWLSSRCHVSLLPMNEIRMVQKSQITTSAPLKYTLDDAWKPNNMLLQTIDFVLNTANMSVCEKIRTVLTTKCRLFNFEVHYSLHGHQQIERQLSITNEHLTSTRMYNDIIAEFPRISRNQQDVVALTGEDFKQLLSETINSATVRLRIEEGTELLTDPLLVDNILKRQLQYKEAHLSEYTDKLWESLYWKPEVTRPDHLAKVINTFIRKDSNDTDHFIYNHQAVKTLGKKNLKEHEIDRLEQLDKHLSTYGNGSSFSSRDHSQDTISGRLNIPGVLESGGDIIQEANRQQSGNQDIQTVNDDHNHRVVNQDHLNHTKLVDNNDTTRKLTRHQVDSYLAKLSEHVHLEGDIIKPRPIDVHLIKTGSFHSKANLVAQTVLVKTRMGVYKAPIRCPEKRNHTADLLVNAFFDSTTSNITALFKEIERLNSLMTQESSRYNTTFFKTGTIINSMVSQLNTLQSRIEDLKTKPSLSKEDVLYVGDIRLFAGVSVPPNWRICNGAILERIIYPKLFNVIGTMYGIGDEDALHFRLPDLRGRVPMGVDAEGVRIGNAKKMGVVGGKAVHVLSIDQLPSHDHDPGYLSTERTGNHTHDIHDPGHAHHIARNLVVGHGPNTGPYGTTRDQWLRHERPDTERSVTGIEIHSSGAHTHKITGRTASTGGGQQFSLVQPYQTFNYIIYAGN